MYLQFSYFFLRRSCNHKCHILIVSFSHELILDVFLCPNFGSSCSCKYHIWMLSFSHNQCQMFIFMSRWKQGSKEFSPRLLGRLLLRLKILIILKIWWNYINLCQTGHNSSTCPDVFLYFHENARTTIEMQGQQNKLFLGSLRASRGDQKVVIKIQLPNFELRGVAWSKRWESATGCTRHESSMSPWNQKIETNVPSSIARR